MYQIFLHRLLPSYPQEPRLLHRRTIFAKNLKSEKIIVWLNVSNCFKQLTICTSCILFCFSKKTQLFHFSNKVFSLVVHWGMKVMGMTKKNVFTIRKLHWRKSQRVSTVILALLCFPCFKNLIFKFKKMKHFAWIFEHGWKNDCNDEKTAVQCLMYENN